jgi:hypothetical protein
MRKLMATKEAERASLQELNHARGELALATA